MTKKKVIVKICSVRNCKQNARSSKARLCNYHYNKQWLKNRESDSSQKCKILNCEKYVFLKKMCKTHYNRQYRNDPSKPKCKIDGCKRPISMKGFCRIHHYHKIKMGPSRPKCKIDGCKRLEQNIGLCNYHYTKKKERDTSRPKCKIDGCKKRTYAQEMCSYHFNRESKKNLRGKLFKILGGKKCVECGYSNELALAFDHIHDDGYKDRKIRILDYRKYINSPSLALERLQVLCANCNHIKLVKNGKWYE